MIIAAVLPSLPVPRSNPLAYPLLWELVGAISFATAYAAVTFAIVLPVRTSAKNTAQFARASATLLSSATTEDHVQYFRDLARSLPTLIRVASFAEHLPRDRVTAFFEFIHREKLERAGYAWSILRIIADPAFCRSLVTRDAWAVSRMLRDLAEARLRSRSIEEFVEQLGAQAIICDDSMLAREIEYHGFGAAPLLLDALFSEPFILDAYNPFGRLSFGVDVPLTSALLERFNRAAHKAYIALIDSGRFGMSVQPTLFTASMRMFSKKHGSFARSPSGTITFPFRWIMQFETQ